MNRRLGAPAVLSVLLLAGNSQVSRAADPGWYGHTTPDRWAEPRTFHTLFDSTFAPRILLLRRPPTKEPLIKVFSPNRAYWFGLSPDSISLRVPREPQDTCRFVILEPDVTISVYSERDHLAQLRLQRHYPNFPIEVRWINEKLLYVQVWWGRIVGTCLVYDAEAEEVLIKEMVHDGRIPFQQWREGQSK